MYTRWAQYYDAIYHDIVDYEGDVDFLEAAFRRYRAKPESILDLGCGTGNHDFPLVRRGYAVTGIDQSPRMVALARKKARGASRRPRFEVGQMQSFQLSRTFDAVICMFGAFGYLVRSEDAIRCLRRARAHLVPSGLFVFEYWHTGGVRPGVQSWISRRTSGDEILRLSEGAFDRGRSQLAMDFHFLVLRRDQVVDRFTEHHVVRTYTRRQMGWTLRQAGFSRIAEFAGTPAQKGFAPVTPTTFRIMAVARRSES